MDPSAKNDVSQGGRKNLRNLPQMCFSDLGLGAVVAF